MELLRSLIFVPGNRPDMLEKAREFDADVIVADLEDSVPESEKERARDLVADAAPTLSGRGQKVVVRLNSLDTGLTSGELRAVIWPHLYGISVGKVESAWEIHEYARLASIAEENSGLEPGSLKLLPWVENSRAVMRAADIGAASSRIVGMAFGAEDYTDDMGIQRTDTGDEVYVPRSLVAIASRATGVSALDSPFVGFRDPAGLKRDIEEALKLGYNGKFAIHPGQLEMINAMFSPKSEDLEYARRVVQAWDQAESAGRGSTSLDGRMIDVPVVKRARNLLALGDAIASKS